MRSSSHFLTGSRSRQLWSAIAAIAWTLAWLTSSAPAGEIHWNGSFSNIWRDVENWDPFGSPFSVHRVPGDTDTAVLSIPTGDVVLLDLNTAQINGLLVNNEIAVLTNGWRLQVDDDGAAVTTIAGEISRIVVEPHFNNELAFQTDNLFLSGGGLLDVGGNVQIEGMTTMLGQSRIDHFDVGTIHFGGDIVVANSTIDVPAFSISTAVTFSPGITLTAQDGALVRLKQPLNFSNGMAIEVKSDADLEVGSLSIGSLIGSAAMLVNGEGSRVALNQQFGVDETLTIGVPLGGPGLLEITNSAEFFTGTGGVLISRTGTLNIAGGNFDARSDVLIDGGQISHTSGNLLLQPGGTLTVVDGGEVSLADNFLLPTTRVLDVDNGGTLSVAGDMTAEGTIHVHSTGGLPDDPGGTLEVAGELAISGEAVNLSQGVVTADAITLSSGAFNFTGGTLHVDVFNGSLVNQGGTLAPGQSAGDTVIIGNYTQQAGSTLEIEIGGDVMATEHDFVNVTGNALLDGDLELALINDFLPDPDDEFVVLNAGNLLSFFSNVGNGQRRSTSDGLGSFVLHYGPTSTFNPDQIVLTDFVPIFGADFDHDGDVDGDDLDEWQAVYGVNALADADADGDSDGRDFLKWQRQFGSGLPVLASLAVPEPATSQSLILIVAVWLLLAISRDLRAKGGRSWAMVV